MGSNPVQAWIFFKPGFLYCLIILLSDYGNKTQRSTEGEWGEIVIRSPFFMGSYGRFGEVGVVMFSGATAYNFSRDSPITHLFYSLNCNSIHPSTEFLTTDVFYFSNFTHSYDWSGQIYVTGSNDGHVFVCDARVSNNFKVLGRLGTGLGALFMNRDSRTRRSSLVFYSE